MRSVKGYATVMLLVNCPGEGGSRMNANGTAIEVVCVTRCNPPANCPGCEQGKSPGGPPGTAQYLPSRALAVLLSRYKETADR